MGVGAEAKSLALLIPGLDGTGLLYYRQLEALSVSHRVRPWRFQKRSHFTLDDLTRELADGTGHEAPGSILVVGESFGGLVALDYVLRYPERVRRLVLVNTFPYYRRRLRIRLACLLAPLLGFRISRLAKEITVYRVLKSEGIPAEDRLRYREAIRQVDLASYRCRLRLVQEVDLRQRLPQIAVPTVLLASGRDKIVPSVAEARFMSQRIPNACRFEFREAGHALLLTPGISLADYVREKPRAGSEEAPS